MTELPSALEVMQHAILAFPNRQVARVDIERDSPAKRGPWAWITFRDGPMFAADLTQPLAQAMPCPSPTSPSSTATPPS